ncbi:right-handed parallel beta-helix repeat-containing protein [Niabella insulamsoli]|uniref:right-handed parallel beta-helix repeat-containing protein n=1 Tax=Niabella insulamsoli TaxID=3144874 RepID=UPI0031FC8E02
MNLLYLKTIQVVTMLLIGLPVLCQPLYLKNYLKNNEKDATPAVYQMIQDARKLKNPVLHIEEGTYHFYPDKAFSKYCYVTNHDNSVKAIAFPLIAFKNLEVRGDHASLIFHGLMMPFDIERSENIKVSGVSVDWELPLHSEALIVASNPKAGTFDLEISEDFPYVIQNNNLIFIKEGYRHDLDRSILFDPKRKAVAYNTNLYTPLEYQKEKKIQFPEKLNLPYADDFYSLYDNFSVKVQNLKFTELKKGLVRVSGPLKHVPPVGMVLVCKGQNSFNRLANAFHITHSKNVLLAHINIYHAGGMGIVGERSENISLETVNITTNPDRPSRMVSTTADATHFANCRGLIKINNCTFEQMLDDGTNVHGSYVKAAEKLAANKLAVIVGHYQQGGFTFAEKGDRIGFVDSRASANPAFFNIVKQVEAVNQRYYIITFEDKLDDRITKDFVLENTDWYPELEITNSRFRNNRARGALLSTPLRTIIRNNYFSNMMSAILMPVELSYWYEAGHAQNVLIENNSFGDSFYGGKNNKHSGVIAIHTSLDKNDYIFGKIIIRNNLFNNFDNQILEANGVNHLEFYNNTIKDSKSFAPLHPEKPVIDVNHINFLKIQNNTWRGKNLPADQIVKERIAADQAP